MDINKENQIEEVRWRNNEIYSLNDFIVRIKKSLNTLKEKEVFLEMNDKYSEAYEDIKKVIDIFEKLLKDKEYARSFVIEGKLYELQKDYDGDGLTNEKELIYGTNPYLKDTDGDGINDKEQVLK